MLRSTRETNMPGRYMLPLKHPFGGLRLQIWRCLWRRHSQVHEPMVDMWSFPTPVVEKHSLSIIEHRHNQSVKTKVSCFNEDTLLCTWVMEADVRKSIMHMHARLCYANMLHNRCGVTNNTTNVNEIHKTSDFVPSD